MEDTGPRAEPDGQGADTGMKGEHRLALVQWAEVGADDVVHDDAGGGD